MKFRIRRRLMLSGLIFALSFLFVFTAAAASESVSGPVSMEVEYGYNNVAKGGRYVPVTVTITNKKDETFQGNVTISTMEADYQVYTYSIPVSIEANSTKKVSSRISFGQGSDQVFVVLSDRSGSQVMKKRLKMDISRDTPELFVGILSDTPEKLEYLNGVGISYGSLKTRSISLFQKDIPEEAIGLDLMDVILVTNYRLRDLSEQQTKAIMEWVRDGGILILGTGERVDETLGRFAPELLDDNYDTPEYRSVHIGETGESQSMPEVKVSCVDIPLHGANILDSDEGFPLFQAAAMEKGMVAVAAYDFADISDFAAQEPTYTDNMFTGLLGDERIWELCDDFYGGSSEEFWAVQNVINSGNVNRLPKVGIYMAVLILYILLAGPGIWLFLRKQEMRNYYWGAVTMLSLVFVAVIYLMGMGTRFKNTFLTYATIRDVSAESIIEVSYVNVRNPYNKPYSLEFSPDYSIRPVSRNTSYSYTAIPKFTEEAKSKLSVFYRPEKTRLEFHEATAFDSNYLQLWKTTENKENQGITGEIDYFDGKITGTVTNQYDFKLEDSAVLMYGELILLGDLEPGETKDLSELPALCIPVGQEQVVAGRVTGLDEYDKADIDNKQYVQDMERANLLAFYIRQELEGYRREARVVGFADGRKEQFMGVKKLEADGMNLFTSAIAVCNETEDGEIYRSALMKAPKAQKGNYDYIRNSVFGIDAVTLEYSLGNDINVDEITFCETSPEILENNVLGQLYVFDGDMYFYNFNTGNYDKMEKGKKVFYRSELEPYLSPGNAITIKYIDSRQEEYGWNTILPLPMVKGREK